MDLATKLADGSYPMKIGNDIFQASIITDKDYADIDNYIRSEFINMAYSAAELLKPHQRQSLISTALREAVTINYATFEGQEIIWREDGVMRLGFHSIRKRHPNMDLNGFIKLCQAGKTEEEQKKNRLVAVAEITKVFNILNLLSDEDMKLLGAQGGASTENDKSADAQESKSEG